MEDARQDVRGLERQCQDDWSGNLRHMVRPCEVIEVRLTDILLSCDRRDDDTCRSLMREVRAVGDQLAKVKGRCLQDKGM
jgi:hypothetical protein